MFSPDQLRHVVTGRDGRLTGKVLGPYIRCAQKHFRLTGMVTQMEWDRLVGRIDAKLGTKVRCRKVIGRTLYEYRYTDGHKHNITANPPLTNGC
jgi:hypothetical protein